MSKSGHETLIPGMFVVRDMVEFGAQCAEILRSSQKKDLIAEAGGKSANRSKS